MSQQPVVRTLSDADLAALVDLVRRSCYTFIVVQRDGPPIVGGHHDKLEEIREEAEYILSGKCSWWPTVSEALIVDAVGRCVWSKKREQVAEMPRAGS